ncbi:T9SS type A sorting domain-containing protein [Pontibacter sp. 172403-2]|uniref:T9SS type A sorting domain-containing protein n=1 Tax=Pontibacter rufus TaxID=2791028 RepID=UPI0018AF7F2B|nr:T9SS type A sorting domain-containing protein [Pontibacter sp. 172403-2]MBF9255369.1 T9SS type A sorting domain-containing protein [Pontibacter sp. 172403-2]
MKTNFTSSVQMCSACFCMAILMVANMATAQVSMSKYKTTYAQDFNVLPSSGTAAWEDGTAYMPGWYVQRTIPSSTLTANAGNSNTGGLYSYGSSGAADRALGSISSLKAGEFAYGLLLQNNTGDTIQQLDISFYGEQWRISNSTAGEHQIAFYYAISTDAAAFDLSPGSDKNWTAYPDLNFKGPKFKTTGGALNGNAAENRRLVSASIPVSIPDGAYVMLRWRDADELEADHGLAIDEFSLAWSINSPDVLPVELVEFTAESSGDAVKIAWQTASEEQNDFFLVERGTEESGFKSIGRVQGNGTTSLRNNYTFLDEEPVTGTAYYRLKQVDEDGTYTYSAVVAVTRAPGRNIVKVYPTVTSELLNIAWEGQSQQRLAMVVDAKGRQVLQQALSGNMGRQVVDVSGLQRGIYMLMLLDENGQRITSRFVRE